MPVKGSEGRRTSFFAELAKRIRGLKRRRWGRTLSFVVFEGRLVLSKQALLVGFLVIECCTTDVESVMGSPNGSGGGTFSHAAIIKV